MLRRFVAACVVLFAVAGLLTAADFKGKITKIDTGSRTSITVKMDDKEETFRLGRSAKVLDDKGTEIKASDLKVDDEVSIKYEEVDRNGQKVKRVSEIKKTK
jgi:hypothetical protein